MTRRQVAAIATFILALAAALGILATASGGRVASAAAATPRAAHASAGLCPGGPGAPVSVLLVVEENKAWTNVHGHSPYLNSLANQCAGMAKGAYKNLIHPSLPNYIAMTSGGFHGLTHDCNPGHKGCRTAAPSIFGYTPGPKVYAESMTSNCQFHSSSGYVARHTAFPYYTGVDGLCQTNDVPMNDPQEGLVHDATAGTLPRFSMLIPDLSNDEHDGSIARGDAWLAQHLSVVFAGSQYQEGRLLVIVTYDETGGGGHGGLYTVFAAKQIQPGTVIDGVYDHFSLLRLMERLTSAPRLGHSATANGFYSKLFG